MEAKQKKPLSETFMDLINPAPLSFDPEQLDHSESAAKLVENEDSYEEEEESVPSTLRKRKFEFLEDDDERYEGTKVSRKSLGMDESDSDVEQNRNSEVGSSDEKEEESDENNEDNDDHSPSEEEDENSTGYSSGEDNDNFQHISSKSSDIEVEKGIAVRNQLKLWDSLLECRISLQKTLIAANKLPQHGVFRQFLSQGSSELKSQLHQTKSNVSTLLDKLITFQTIMIKSYPETKNLDKTETGASTETDEEIRSDTEGEEEHHSSCEGKDEQKKEKYETCKRSLKEYAKLLDEQYVKYKNYRNSTIQKWNDKTRISVGKLSSRNFSNFEQSALKQIEQVLSNRQRLIERTQLKRSSYNILGQELICETDNQVEESVPSADTNDLKNDHEQNKEYNTEIFDDTDFYHQLLRDLIEKKSSDITDPVQLGRQWLKLQKLRSKMKRKIDTRATKGRKIRYVVHPKLVNFMAPEDKNIWTEEAKTELFSSLFGNKK